MTGPVPPPQGSVPSHARGAGPRATEFDHNEVVRFVTQSGSTAMLAASRR